MDMVGVLLGAIVGGAIAHFTQNATWKREESREARLALARVRRRIWADDYAYVDVMEALGECRVRMTTLGISQERINALEEATVRCWQYIYATVEAGSGPEGGHIAGELHEWFLQVIAVLDDELLGSRRLRARKHRPLPLPTPPKFD